MSRLPSADSLGRLGACSIRGVRTDVLELYASAGLTVLHEQRKLRLIETPSPFNRLAKVFDFRPFRTYFTFQYVHRLGVRAPAAPTLS